MIARMSASTPTSRPALQAPFPWFGGKSRVADIVWRKFGNVPNYVEPFAGSLAVLLGRPHEPRVETVNDLDGFVANFWRAMSTDAEQVLKFADWPVNENDLTARHVWLVGQREGLQKRLEGDPAYFDAKIAGWWVWGLCNWIGGGWCSGKGPWHADEGGALTNDRQLPHLGGDLGVNRQLPHLSGDLGVNRKLPHLGGDRGVNRQLPRLSGDLGVNRQLPHLSGDLGVNRKPAMLVWFEALQVRLRRVRVCSGDWLRVCQESVTTYNGLTGVFLDPPYDSERADVYACETRAVSADVRAWAIENGDNPLLRIALCGYDTEHPMPATWACVAWKSAGGYGAQGVAGGQGRINKHRERIWFSPHCYC
jgi:hypothetical protein